MEDIKDILIYLVIGAIWVIGAIAKAKKKKNMAETNQKPIFNDDPWGKAEEHDFPMPTNFPTPTPKTSYVKPIEKPVVMHRDSMETIVENETYNAEYSPRKNLAAMAGITETNSPPALDHASQYNDIKSPNKYTNRIEEAEEVNPILENFNLADAVIYSEILKPKFD